MFKHGVGAGVRSCMIMSAFLVLVLFVFYFVLVCFVFLFFLFLFLSLFTYATEYKFYRNDATIFFSNITFVAIVT